MGLLVLMSCSSHPEGGIQASGWRLQRWGIRQKGLGTRAGGGRPRLADRFSVLQTKRSKLR